MLATSTFKGADVWTPACPDAQGQISFLWYIKRDMGAVNKVFRGLASQYYGPEESLFPLKEKPWIATLDTFAIGGGCQYLLVMDHIMAEKGSYMTLPA